MNFKYYPNNIIEMEFSMWFIFVILISIVLFSYCKILYKEYCHKRMNKIITKYGINCVKYSTKVFKWKKIKFVFDDNTYYSDGLMYLIYFTNNKPTK